MSKYYVVSDGELTLSFDSPSGGYPCTTRSLQNAKMTTDVNKAFGWLKQAGSIGIRNAKVFEIVMAEVDVSVIKRSQEKLNIMIEKLSPEEIQYLKGKLK